MPEPDPLFYAKRAHRDGRLSGPAYLLISVVDDAGGPGGVVRIGDRLLAERCMVNRRRLEEVREEAAALLLGTLTWTTAPGSRTLYRLNRAAFRATGTPQVPPLFGGEVTGTPEVPVTIGLVPHRYQTGTPQVPGDSLSRTLSEPGAEEGTPRAPVARAPRPEAAPAAAPPMGAGGSPAPVTVTGAAGDGAGDSSGKGSAPGRRPEPRSEQGPDIAGMWKRLRAAQTAERRAQGGGAG